MTVGKRILVVDDNAANRKLSELQLKKMGYECEVVMDGVAALALLQADACQYSLVLMDCHMPGLNGFETVIQMRQAHIVIPVIGFTASTDPDDKEKAERCGMTAFVSRPVQMQTLRTIIEGVLPK